MNSTTRLARSPQRGQPSTISLETQHQLIELAIADAYHCHLPLTQIADLSSMRIRPHAVRHIFASDGYHRRIAHVKPYLAPVAQVKAHHWGETYHD